MRGEEYADKTPMTSNADRINWDGPAPAGQVLPPDSRFAGAPGMQPVPNFPPPNDRDLMVMTNKLSGGSVELYSLDSAPSAPPPGVPSLPTSNQGMRAVTEPSVTVYPLSDNGPYPGQFTQAAPAWPNALLPSPSMESMPLGQFGGAPVDGPVSKVYFKHGSSNLGSNDLKVIADASDKARFAPVNRISVEGHASKRANTGDYSRDSIVNLKESMNRAFEVSKTMILNGVPSEKIKTTAYGDTKPPSVVMRDEEAESRRVEIYTGSGY